MQNFEKIDSLLSVNKINKREIKKENHETLDFLFQTIFIVLYAFKYIFGKSIIYNISSHNSLTHISDTICQTGSGFNLKMADI